MSAWGVGGSNQANCSSRRPAGQFQLICSASNTMDSLVNEPRSHALVRRQQWSQPQIARGEPPRLLAQQNARGDAGLAPGTVEAIWADGRQCRNRIGSGVTGQTHSQPVRCASWQLRRRRAGAPAQTRRPFPRPRARRARARQVAGQRRAQRRGARVELGRREDGGELHCFPTVSFTGSGPRFFALITANLVIGASLSSPGATGS